MKRRNAMAVLFLLLLALAIWRVAGGHHSRSTTPHVQARYYFTAEEAYVDIQVIDSRLVVTYLPKTFRRESFNYQGQRPWYSQRDLRHATASLTDRELTQFINLVKSTGFLELPQSCGTTLKARYYPYKISVKIDGKENAVTYRSRPSAPPMPQAFAKVQDWLMAMAKAKMKDF